MMNANAKYGTKLALVALEPSVLLATVMPVVEALFEMVSLRQLEPELEPLEPPKALKTLVLLLIE